MHGKQVLPLLRRRIVVVDDYHAITSLLSEFLTSCGALVATANDSRAAAGLLASDCFDLAVIETGMQTADGCDLVGFVEAAYPELLRRTILLTVDRRDRRVVELSKAHGTTHLLKPFVLADLANLACRVLTRPTCVPAA